MSDRDTEKRPRAEPYFYGVLYYCTECGHFIGRDGHHEMRYCQYCGQKIDWSDVE